MRMPSVRISGNQSVYHKHSPANKPKKIKPTVHRADYLSNDATNVALVIDGSNMFVRNCCAPHLAQLTNPNGQKTGGLYGTLKSLVSEISVWRPNVVYFVIDREGSHRKKRLFSEYKANRGRGLKSGLTGGEIGSDLDERLEQEARQRQIEILESLLPSLGVRFCMIPGMEADDIIGNLITLHKYTVIVSTDTDFIQLHNGVTVFVYNPFTHRVRTSEEFGVIGPSYAVLKSAIGDPSDNVDGIRGLGWKTLVRWCKGEFPVDLEGFRKLIKVRSKNKQDKMARKLLDNWKLIERNFALIALDPNTTEVTPQLVSLMKGWRNNPPHVDFNYVRKIFKDEDISSDFLMTCLTTFQSIKKGGSLV